MIYNGPASAVAVLSHGISELAAGQPNPVQALSSRR